MAKLKVWDGLMFIKSKQVKAIIATTTKKEAIKLLNMTLYEFNSYWSETGNDISLKTALLKPNTIFIATGTLKYDFKELKADGLG